MRNWFAPGLRSGLHVDAPLAKHVVSGQDELVVEIDLGVGVEPFEDEVDVLLREQGRRGLNSGAVFPVGVLDPLQLGFVVAVEGVGNQFVAQQVEMDAAGNDGGVPLRCVAGGRSWQPGPRVR